MKGYIYTIRSHQTDDVYYGSTKQRLSNRMSQHRQDFKRGAKYTAAVIMKYSDAYIELVEEIEYENKNELLAREGYFIRNNACVNKIVPDLTVDEKKQNYQNYDKLYAQRNKEHIRQYRKEYVEKNREKLNAYMRQYRPKKCLD